MVTITLLLDSALGDALDDAAICEAAQRAAQQLCERLGVPAAPTLSLARASLPYGLAALTVEGVRCRHADSLERQIFAAQRGALYMPSHTATIAAWLREQPERLPPFLSAFVYGALSDQAALLLSDSALAAYRDLLPEPLMDYSLTALREALTPLLAMRVSLRAVETVAQVLERAPESASEALFAALRPQRLAIYCAQATLRQLTETASEAERQLFNIMRDGLFDELGVHLPSFAFAVDDALPLNQFSLQINDLPSLPWQGLSADQVLVSATVEQLRARGVPSAPAYNVATGRLIALAHSADAEAIRAEGFHIWTPFGHLILNISALMRHYSALLICQRVAQRALEQIELAFPALAESAKARITPAQLARLLRALAAENVSVRNMRLILEAIAAYDYILVPPDYIAFDDRLSVSAPPSFESGLLAFVRAQLSRQLTQQAARERNPIPVLLLAPDLERAALQGAEQARQRLLGHLRAQVAQTPESPPIVLTANEARAAVRALIGVELPQVRVLAYSELLPEVSLQPIARLALGEG
jgi:flagellar biosynthesis component FlhA